MLLLGIILGLIINGVIAHIVGNVGKDKKIGYSTSFWVSFLLSPLIGLLLVIASVPLSEREIEELNNDKPTTIKPTTIETYRQLSPEEYEKKEKTEKIVFYTFSLILLLFVIYTLIHLYP